MRRAREGVQRDAHRVERGGHPGTSHCAPGGELDVQGESEGAGFVVDEEGGWGWGARVVVVVEHAVVEVAG